jgi:hypothetical protein
VTAHDNQHAHQERPLSSLSDDELYAELDQCYRTRVETLRHGSDASLENSTRRIDELEGEYCRRHPQREVSARRLRPTSGSLRTGGEGTGTPT